MTIEAQTDLKIINDYSQLHWFITRVKEFKDKKYSLDSRLELVEVLTSGLYGGGGRRCWTNGGGGNNELIGGRAVGRGRTGAPGATGNIGTTGAMTACCSGGAGGGGGAPGGASCDR